MLRYNYIVKICNLYRGLVSNDVNIVSQMESSSDNLLMVVTPVVQDSPVVVLAPSQWLQMQHEVEQTSNNMPHLTVVTVLYNNTIHQYTDGY